MKDLDHNEEMMRKRLTEPLEGSPKWAEPSASVWEGIAAHINNKTTRRRGGWWFLLPLFLLATILVLVLQSTIGTTQQEEEINITEKATHFPFPSKSDSKGKNDAILPASATKGLMTPNHEPSTSPSRFKAKEISPDPLNKQDIRAVRTRSPLLPSVLLPSTHEDQGNNTFYASENSPAESSSDNAINPTLTQSLSSEKDERLYRELTLIPTLQSLLEKEIPLLVLSPSPAPPLQKTWSHHILLQAHGWAGDRTIHTHQNTSPLPVDMDREHHNYRFGVGYQWQHTGGWILGAGVEYQQFNEESIHQRTWQFTKANAQMTPGGYNQSLSMNIPTSMGQMEAQLRIGILEQNAPLDYQEGEEVNLTLKLNQSLKQVRIPLYTGYHYARNAWFIEARGGVGLSLLTDYDASITRILEARNRIRMREIPLIRRPNGLKTTMWDIHGGLHIGHDLTEHWKLSAGYEMWQSISSVASRPGYTTSLEGYGVTVGLRYQF